MGGEGFARRLLGRSSQGRRRSGCVDRISEKPTNGCVALGRFRDQNALREQSQRTSLGYGLETPSSGQVGDLHRSGQGGVARRRWATFATPTPAGRGRGAMGVPEV